MADLDTAGSPGGTRMADGGGTIGHMTDEGVGHWYEQWQLDGNAAELYQRRLVPAVTAGWAADLIERVGLRRGERVLDAACGTGVVARAAAEWVGRTGHVAGIDINPGMLAVARSLPAGAGASVGWLQGSVLSLPFLAGSYDLVLCQLGLQFFPDRSAALTEMRRVLVAGGRLGLSVYGPIEHNPAAFALAGALDRHLGPDASVAKRAEHALADPALLRMLAAGAGFDQVQIVTETRIIRFVSAADYVGIQLTATPLASLFREQAERSIQQLAETLIADVAAALQPYQADAGLAFPQQAHVLLASA
jgi:SAM-dependent methyltransferase